MQTTIPLLQLSNTTFYAFRIKNLPDIDLDKTYDGFKSFKYSLLSLEGMGKYADPEKDKHIHGLVSSEDRGPVVDTIKKIYPDCKGNKCYSVSLVKDVKQCAKYTLKEGHYKYSGFTNEFIRSMYRSSSKKENLKNKVSENEQHLLDKTIHFEVFAIRYLRIKVEHNQNINNSHVISYLNKMMLKSSTITYEDYYSRFLSLH